MERSPNHKVLDDLRQIVDEKLRQNQDCRAEMLSVIASGESVAFVGAGLSRPLGYHLWDGLLADLHGKAEELAPFTVAPEIKADALQWADAIKAHFSTHNEELYYELLGRSFEPRTGAKCTATQKLLAGLPFRGFVTLNYETCLEAAIGAVKGDVSHGPCVAVRMDRDARHRVSTFLRSLTNAPGPLFVAHLHGQYEDPRNMILTAKDYQTAYGIGRVDGTEVSPEQVTLHRKLAWTLFASRQLVFVGCSMNDPYINALLNAVRRDIWEMSQKNHYVILPLGAEDLNSVDAVAGRCDRNGLQVVYYDNFDGSRLGLDQLLRKAEALRPTPAHDNVSILTPMPAAAKLAPTGTSGSAGWLEEANQRNVPKLTDE